MTEKKNFEVLIIGGSYAGLSAAMALGRSMRLVLIIDSGKPCNIQAPHSHNFLTQDGQTPGQITAIGKEQVLQYKTIQVIHAKAVSAKKMDAGFEVVTESGVSYTGNKILFATGIADQMLSIQGFAECWGITIAHCPYCHGYEVRDTALGVLANGDAAFELCRMINHWSKNLTLFTNGKSTLAQDQENKIRMKNINIAETEIESIENNDGRIQNIVFKDGATCSIAALFTRVPFEQHCRLPEELGCTMTKDGFIETDDLHRTNIAGVYAAGDNSTPLRAVSAAVAAGTKAGAFINKELIDESFENP
ncbi:MAG: NAD(P)/FAD-dependent oxidoreductase [Chitinophagaceae bacterium]|nr:NAD(P)/FAD-dependent oxidoreductase [Chitinophagaceae bacterium]